MAGTLLDVTDLVEFLQRRESVSGVQRVIAETAPLLLVADSTCRAVVLDRGRGVFVALTDDETHVLVFTGAGSGNPAPDRARMATVATACLARAQVAEPVGIDDRTVALFLGAVWINDALMTTARAVHAAGARCVYLLYDLTPVLQAGHTAAVNRLFHRYLTLVTQTASAVPAISASSRRDYEAYCADVGSAASPGGVTGLPCGISPTQFAAGESPWPRPYALFVGTIEARKNHVLAMSAWEALVRRHRPEAVPDLVCIGRLGWNADEFLREYVVTGGLDGKVSLLTTSVSDADLARFYAHAMFTVYPSRYEGWGLPVSESLAFGRLPIVADNSSLREAGGDVAVYFTDDDVDALVDAIETQALDQIARRHHEERIAAGAGQALTWSKVAAIIGDAVAHARTTKARGPVHPTIELGREYVLASATTPPDSGYADQYLAHLQRNGRTPMMGQPRGDHDAEVTDPAIVGLFGSPQVWGTELLPGRRADIRLSRPVDGPLVMLLSTRSMPGLVTIDVVGPGGPLREDVHLGSVIAVPLGDGVAGQAAQACLTVTDADDSVEGFLGICSFVVLRADDLQAQVIAHRSAAAALRQELDFMAGTRSWRVTAPLRRWKGRGAS